MSTKGGRPRTSERAVINAIWYVLWTGCQWRALHRERFGVSSSVVHERFQRSRQMGVFEKLMKRMAEYYARESMVGSTGSGKLWIPNTLQLLWEGRKPGRTPPTGARQERR